MKRLLRLSSPLALAFLLGAACLCFAVFASVAFAQGDTKAQQENEPAPDQSPTGQIFRWLNFIIIFGGGGYLIAKKTPPLFRARANEIWREITAATEAKAQAERQLREAEAGLARMDQESAAIRETARQEFAQESERIREGTRREVERIDRAADVEIDASSRAALMALRRNAARQAVERAAALVAQQMTPERRQAMFQAFIRNLPRGAN